MISISTGSIYHLGLERAFQIIKKAGFKYIELLLRSINSEAYLDTWDTDYLKRLESKYQLKVLTIHTDFMHEEDPKDLKRVYNLAKALKAEYIILHLPRKKQSKYIKWFKKNIKDFQTKSTKILVENMGDETIWKSAKKLNEFAGMCFDISHSMRSNENTIEILKKLKNIKQFHISGFDGENCHKSINEGKNIIKNILSKNKKSIFCLEISPKAFEDRENLNGIVKELIFSKKFLEKIQNE